MSFKPNDYNAYLSSLFERGNNGGKRDANASMQEHNQDTNTSHFPIDFDFGISMSNVMASNTDYINKQVSSVPYRGSEYLAEMNADNTLVGNDYSQEDRINSQNLPQNNERKWEIDINPYLNQGFIEGKYGDTISQESPISPISEKANNQSTQFKQKVQYPPQFEGPMSPLSKPGSIFKTNQDLSLILANSDNSSEHIKGKHRQKSAHNVIEQRYRNKINDKFTALQDAVPTLRVVAKKKRADSEHASSPDKQEEDEYEGEVSCHTTDFSENLEGLEPAKKLNKGTILAKSIEYIKFLETKNMRMKTENDELMLKAKMLGIILDEKPT